jgi:hypothetical protein
VAETSSSSYPLFYSLENAIYALLSKDYLETELRLNHPIEDHRLVIKMWYACMLRGSPSRVDSLESHERMKE